MGATSSDSLGEIPFLSLSLGFLLCSLHSCLGWGRAPGGWVRTSFLHLSPQKSDLQAEPTSGEVPSAVTDLTINL